MGKQTLPVCLRAGNAPQQAFMALTAWQATPYRKRSYSDAVSSSELIRLEPVGSMRANTDSRYHGTQRHADAGRGGEAAEAAENHGSLCRASDAMAKGLNKGLEELKRPVADFPFGADEA